MLNGTICAEVAELADAQDLGSCGRKAVGVQLPPSADQLLRLGRKCANNRMDIGDSHVFSVLSLDRLGQVLPFK
jgi:hypothetical protein